MRGCIRYQKEMQKTYLIIQAEKELIESYGGQMVMRNKVNRLAECEMQLVDGEREIRYDITSLQTIVQVFAVKEMDFRMLQKLLYQIGEMLEEAERYLLDARQLCFEPEYLYWAIEKEELSFLFDYTELHEEGTLRKLAEFVLERICHEEEKTVDLAYFFFSCVEKESFCIKEIEAYLEEKESMEGKIDRNIVESVKKDIGRNEKAFTGENAEESKVEYKKLMQEYPVQKELCDSDSSERTKETLFQNKEKFSWYSRSGAMIEGGLAAVFTALLIGIAFWGVEKYFILTELEKRIWLGIAAVLFAGGMAAFVAGFLWERKHSDKNTKENENEGKEAKGKELKRKDSMGKNPIGKDLMGKEASMPDTEWEIFEMQSENISDPTDGKTVYVGDSLLYREYKLVQMKRGEEREYPVSVYPLLIGKDKEHVNLQVKDRSVSRIHARLIREGSDIYIEDLHSTNGTYVNDLLLTPHEQVKLRRGDILQFGKSEFVLR